MLARMVQCITKALLEYMQHRSTHRTKSLNAEIHMVWFGPRHQFNPAVSRATYNLLHSSINLLIQ
jgi:hypothetical protein